VNCVKQVYRCLSYVIATVCLVQMCQLNIHSQYCVICISVCDVTDIDGLSADNLVICMQ